MIAARPPPLEQVLLGEALDADEVLGRHDGAQRIEDRLLRHQLADERLGDRDAKIMIGPSANIV